ncbi:MAG: redoxin domain-containing protein [Chthoniobacteraceae bacterium]
MKKLLFVLAIAAALAALSSFYAHGEPGVVRPAPNFTWVGAPGHTSLASMKGQPVVLLIAKSPKEGAFQKQAKNLQKIYQQFASRGAVFAAAFTEEGGVIRSNIPFATVNNGAQVAASYGTKPGFTIVIIGKDGNVDYETTKVLPAQRVHDVIQNSYAVQAAERKSI